MNERKHSLAKILTDDEALAELIQHMADEIENTKDIDKTTDMILNNVLEKYNYFNDYRALKPSAIEAVTNLLKLKQDLPLRRIQLNKTLLDMAVKKKELEIKASAVTATREIANSTNNLVNVANLFLNNLDKTGIHPIITDVEIIEIGNSENSIIDTHIEDELLVDDINNENISSDIEKNVEEIIITDKNKQMFSQFESLTSAKDILELQHKFEEMESLVE